MTEEKKKPVIPEPDPPPPALTMPTIPSNAQADVNGVRLKTFHVGSTDLAEAVQGARNKFNEWSQANLDMDVVCIEQSIHSVAMKVPDLTGTSGGSVQVMHHVVLWVWHSPTRLPADVRVLLIQVQRTCELWQNPQMWDGNPDGRIYLEDEWKAFQAQMQKLVGASDKVFQW